MKIKYRYEISGSLKPDTVFPLKISEYSIDFVLDNKTIVALNLTKDISLNKLPKFLTQDTDIPELKMEIDDMAEVESSLRLAEGLLAPFGLRAIKLDKWDIEFIPETEEEKTLLVLKGIKKSDSLVESQENQVIPFFFIAGALIAGFQSNKYEVALSFFRKGKNAMRDNLYIEAYYHFYFVLEALYSRGHTKNSKVEANFLNSRELTRAIEEVVAEGIENQIRPENKESYMSEYKNKTVDQIVRSIVKKRGFIHHQNPKHPSAWNPDEQTSLFPNALFLMHVTNKIILNIVLEYIYAESVQELYSDSYISHL